MDFLYSHTAKQELENLLTIYNLSVLISVPTRVTVNSSTIIDNVFTNFAPALTPKVVETGFSDHMCQIISLPLTKSKKQQLRESSHYWGRQFKKENIENFILELSVVDWSVVDNEPETDGKYNQF